MGFYIRRQEKKLDKEAKEKARKLEKEQAKLDKIRRNTEKISRSTERVGGSSRSGSLERRRSGDDSPVINQSTVHGIASPSRRPTIFDAFRLRTKSDAKKVRDKDAAKSSGSSEKDNISTSSGTVQRVAVGGGGDGHKTSASHKDGSAHPHPGSDAQVGFD